MGARRCSMHPALLLIILIIAVCGANSQQSGGSKRNGREPCSKMVLKNGKIKVRSNGRVVKFTCNRDYVLVGESTSTCLMGEWTSEPPVCATKGCPPIPSPPSGRFIATNGGAVMRLECNPGYRPSGSPMIYCVDRFDWNGTAPLCQASGVQQSATRCDFESDDLCGWVQDTRTDEFDWTWQNYGTPSLHLGTGPSFDHTLGQGKAGHYLFIESSSPRILNDTARLFSPVYGPPESSTISEEGVCFTFWFHMYGSTTGQLNVYIKPESKKMSELRPAFVRSGDQGDKWRQGYISLDRVTENFQVVIEGVRGTGYVGDSAIDDVQLTKGEQCLAALKRMMADTVVPGGSTTQPSSTVPPTASCVSRCSTTANQQWDNTTSWTCGCSDDCLLKNSCCSDYAAFCLTGRTDTSTAATTKDGPTVSTTASPSQTTSTIATTLMTTSPPAPITPSTTSTTVATTTVSTTTLGPATSTFLTTTSSVTPSPPMTVPASTSAATTTIIPSTTASSTIMVTTPTTTSTTTERPTTITSSRATTWSSTTLAIPTVTTTVEPSTTTTIKPTTSNPISTTTAIATDTFRPTVVATTRRTTTATSVSSTTATTSSRPTSVLVTGDPPQDGLQGDDDQSGIAADDPSPSTGSQASSPSWVTGAVVAAAMCMALLLTVGVAAVVVRSRRAMETGGVNGRRRRPKLRSSQQDQLAEDSDVRYLRDEDDVQLDLTEATPSPQSAASSQRQFADFERL